MSTLTTLLFSEPAKHAAELRAFLLPTRFAGLHLLYLSSWPHLGLSSSERFSNQSFEKSSPVHLSYPALFFFLALIITWHSILIDLLVDCYLPALEYKPQECRGFYLPLSLQPLALCLILWATHMVKSTGSEARLLTGLKLSSSQLWNLRQVSYLLICIVGIVIGM